MKKKILTILIMCVLVMSTFVGCNTIKLKDNPDINAPVTSNGGLVVQKGEYIYFTNGYVSVSDLSTGDNKYNKVTYADLCRAKTTNNALNYNVETDEDGEEIKTLKDIEVVVPKIVSCDNGGFYIFDDYIYYASPTIEKDKTGESRFDLITFFCCKIDGSNTKKLYAVDKYGADAKFNMIKVDDTLYIEIYDGTSITILSVAGNKVKSTKEVSSGSSITATIFPAVETYNKTNNAIDDNETYVYYTRSVLDSENYTNCNVLCRASIKTAEEEILVADNTNTISLIDYFNGKIYYKATEKNLFHENYVVYASDLSSIAKDGVKTTDQISFIDSTNIYVYKNTAYTGIIANVNDQIRLVIDGKIETLYDGKITVLKVVSDTIFAYNSNNQIIRINISEKTSETILSEEGQAYFDTAINFDICGNHIYYFNTYTGEKTGYYLNRIELNSEESEAEFLGILDDAHIEKEETDED